MLPDDDAHRKWKRCAAPLYDWMTNHHLVWPALACRFGPREEIAGDETKYAQTVYMSEQVAKEEKTPNKLIMQTVHVPEENYAPMDHINTWKENQKSPYFSKNARKVINHPGECNKIREVRQHDRMVVTHSDCEEVYLWDFDKQPDWNSSSTAKGNKKYTKNTPDLRLTGHTAQAPFALATSDASPSIASGGEDTHVMVWNLEDHAGTVLNREAANGRPGEALQARSVLRGHGDTVTDVCFRPGSDRVLASASDDHIIKLWDTRQRAASHNVRKGDDHDIMCIDWSANETYLASGDANGIAHIYDVRMLADERTAPLFTFSQLTPDRKSMLSVCWSSLQPSFFACGGEDGRVTVYDISRPDADTADALPAQLVLQHVGHLGNIMDAQWSPHEPFLLMSVSNDGDTYKDGGAAQLWRLSWLLYADIDECENELKGYQTWLEKGKMSDLKSVITLGAAPKRQAMQPPSTDAAEPAAAAIPADLPSNQGAAAGDAAAAKQESAPEDAGGAGDDVAMHGGDERAAGEGDAPVEDVEMQNAADGAEEGAGTQTTG